MKSRETPADQDTKNKLGILVISVKTLIKYTGQIIYQFTVKTIN